MKQQATITAFDHNGQTLRCVAKTITAGSGLATLRTWLGDADAVIIHDGGDPVVIMRWGPWARITQALVNRRL